MAPLEGATLGEKHRHYNQLLKEAINSNQEITKINHEDDDVDNLIRIDIASHRRDVEYIIEVFKGNDMLYVNRAIKNTAWLMEDQYIDIINPKYLQESLFPEMTNKAIRKLMLHIRKNLKNEQRLEEFYNFVNETNSKEALKWVPNCSKKFVEDIVQTRTKEMQKATIKRIGRKSKDILKQMIVITNGYGCKTSSYESIYLIRSNLDEFLNLIETMNFAKPYLNAKITSILMKKRRERIINNFHIYVDTIHLDTVAKFIKREEVEDFLLSRFIINPESHRTFEQLYPFLKKIQRDRMLEFLKKLFKIVIDKDPKDKRSEAEIVFQNIELSHRFSSTPRNMYRWYEFASFRDAFRDIKKFTYSESSSEERHYLLNTLLKCCDKNLEQAKIVIKFYHEKRINEPYWQKITFVNCVLENFDAFRFDDDLWKIINELFQSLEVYIESNNNVYLCVQHVILYKILRDESVPEIIENKLKFSSFNDYRNKLNDVEKEKVFNYLYQHEVTRLNNHSLDNFILLQEAAGMLYNIWTLLEVWNKKEMYNEFLTNKLSELCDVNSKEKWNVNLDYLYRNLRPYHKPLLDKSIRLRPHEDACLNILRHDAKILTRDQEIINDLFTNEKIALKRVLSKLRIYWPESLGKEWRDNYLKNINENMTIHKAFIPAIITLSSEVEVLNLVNEYVPSEAKIEWKEGNEIILSLRKHIAKNIHLARPQVSIQTVLLYAKGDYLQHAVCSVLSIYHNLKAKDVEKQIHLLLDAPVSLQKHGIRLAFEKLKTDKLVEISENIWSKSKNSSIRTNIFTLFFNVLCKEKDDAKIDVIWKLFKTFMDNIEQDENKIIFETLVQIDRVPKKLLGEYYEKSYWVIKNLPLKPETRNLFDKVLTFGEQFIEYLNNEFVERDLLGSFGIYNILSSSTHPSQMYLRILVAYLLCSQNEEIQTQKYKNVLEPVIEKCGDPNVNDYSIEALDGVDRLLVIIFEELNEFVFHKKKVMPVKLLSDIEQSLVKYFSPTEKYITLTYWKLCVAFLRLLDKLNSKESSDYNWECIITDSMKPFAQTCVEYLKMDIEKYFPSIDSLFIDALRKLWSNFYLEDRNLLILLDSMINVEDLQVYLFVCKLSPGDCWDDETKEMLNKIQRKMYAFPSQEMKMHYFQKYPRQRFD